MRDPFFLVISIVIAVVVSALVAGAVVGDIPGPDDQADWANETYGEGNWTMDTVDPDCDWYDIGCGGMEVREPVPVNESVPNASVAYDWEADP